MEAAVALLEGAVSEDDRAQDRPPAHGSEGEGASRLAAAGAIIEELIKNFSDPKDLICDPCAGGFTTALACRNLSRRFVGCDVDEDCVAMGQQRLAAVGRPRKPR